MPQDRSGTTLGTYRLEKLLGEGGMGQVYVAVDEKLGRTVALKVLRPEVMADAEHRARFEREAKALAALNHPGIVTIYALEEVDGDTFFVMDLVEGRTLTKVIESEGAMPVSRILDLATPIADAIAAAHKRGIAHRDIKPDNIIIGPRDQVTVLDFGLAKKGGVQFSGGDTDATAPTMHVTLEGKIFGTVNYMAPEQAEAGETNLATDVFSLGVVIYEMATGDLPFKGDTAMSILSSILKDQPVPMATHDKPVPQELESLVERCLEKDPDRRWQSALDVRNELEILKRNLDDPGRRPGAGNATATSTLDERPTVGGKVFVTTSVLTLIGLSLGILIGVMVMNAGRNLGPAGQAGDEVGPPQCVSVSGPEGYEITEAKISPDGKMLAMVTRKVDDSEEGTGETFHGERQFLHLRPIDAFENRLIEDSQRIIAGKFSPDSRTYVFVRLSAEPNLPAKLMRLEVGTGIPPVQVGLIPLNLVGGLQVGGYSFYRGFTWLDDKRLAFVSQIPPKIHIIDSKSGDEISSVDLQTDLEVRPNSLFGAVDSDRFLFAVVYWDEDGYTEEVWWADAVTGKTGVVVGSSSTARVVHGDQLLFTKGSTLYKAGLDTVDMKVTGTAVPVFTGLRTPYSWSSGEFDVAQNGNVVYLPGGLQGSRRTLWTLGEDGGPPQALDHPERAFEEMMSVSADGNQILITHTNDNIQTFDIWAGTLDPARIRRVQGFPDRDIATPVISPDGTLAAAEIVTTLPIERSQLVVFDPAIPGAEVRVLHTLEGGKSLNPHSLHPDNDRMIYGEISRDKTTEILYEIGLEDGAEARELVRGVATNTNASWSPDGTMIAWTSNDSGISEALVATYDSGNVGRPVPVSDGLAQDVAWSLTEDGVMRLHCFAKMTEMVRTIENVDGMVSLGPSGIGRRLPEDSFFLVLDQEGGIVFIRKGLNEAPATRVELITGFFSPETPAEASR